MASRALLILIRNILQSILVYINGLIFAMPPEPVVLASATPSPTPSPPPHVVEGPGTDASSIGAEGGEAEEEEDPMDEDLGGQQPHTPAEFLGGNETLESYLEH